MDQDTYEQLIQIQISMDELKVKMDLVLDEGNATIHVIKNKYNVTPCKRQKRCEELGHHCDMKPIIEKELYDSVNEKCRYRTGRDENSASMASLLLPQRDGII